MERTADGPRPTGFQPAFPLSSEQDEVSLPKAGAWETMAREYRLMQLSVTAHPLALLRPALSREVCPVEWLRKRPNGSGVFVASLVSTRQRPETARGITFLLQEDETRMLNVIVSPELYETDRALCWTETLLLMEGTLQRQALRLNLVAVRAWPLTEVLADSAKGAGVCIRRCGTGRHRGATTSASREESGEQFTIQSRHQIGGWGVDGVAVAHTRLSPGGQSHPVARRIGSNLTPATG